MTSPFVTNDPVELIEGDVMIGTPVLAGKQMSSSLRERLKRAGRCYKSPATTKRLCRTSVESQERAEPCQSGSSSPVCREKSIIDETVPDVTMTKTSAVVKDVAGCSDGELMTPDTTGYLYPSNDKSVNLCQTPTSKRCPKSTGDAVSPCLYVTPCKANDASAAKDINITPRRESVNEEGHDTYNTPCRVKHDLDIGVSSHSSTPVRPTDQTAADMTVQSLKIQKTATLERIAKAEETLRKLKMVKMYRTKNNLTELQRLIELWRGVSQRALEQLLEQTPEPGVTLNSLIDHLQLSHELIGYSVEDDTFVQM